MHQKIGGPFTPRRALLVSQATQRMLIICYVDDDDVDVDVVVDDVGVNLAMMLMILMLMWCRSWFGVGVGVGVAHPLRPAPADVLPHPTESIYYWSMLWCSMFCYYFDATTLMFHVLLLLRCSTFCPFGAPCFAPLLFHVLLLWRSNAIMLCISSTLRGIQEGWQMCECSMFCCFDAPTQ